MAADSFIDLFSTLSHKRRHGILRVRSSGTEFDILFFDGRISATEQRGVQAAQDICARLYKESCLHEKVFQLFRAANVSVPQLYDLLVAKKFVTPEQFQLAKRAMELDLLHSLSYVDEPSFEFIPRDSRPDPRFPTSISPGQLLLDIFELQNDEEKFQAAFGGKDLLDTEIVRCGQDKPRTLSLAEGRLWDLLKGIKQLKELFHTTLCEYEIKEGLLALLDQGLLEVCPKKKERAAAPAAVTAPSPVPVDDDDDEDLVPQEVEEAPDFFDRVANAAVDSILDGFGDDWSLAEEEAMTELAAEPEIRVEPERKPSVISAPVERMPKTPKLESVAAESPPVARLVPEHSPPHGNLPSNGHASPHGVSSPEMTRTEEIAVDDRSALAALVKQFFSAMRERGFRQAAFELNYKFLERDIMQQIIVVTILAYLFCLLLMSLSSSGMISTWFSALSDFASNVHTRVIK